MDVGPVLAARGEGDSREDAARKQRQHFRHPLGSLAYVRLDHANGGIIRNISQSGVAIQAVGRLHAGQVVHLRFDLLRPKVRIDATGQVAWANEFGQAGISFLNLAPRPQRALKEWLMTDLLAAASELAPNNAPILNPLDIESSIDGLIMSAAPIPSIRVESSPTVEIDNNDEEASAVDHLTATEMPLRFSWWPADISPRTFSGFVDSLVVVSAVLLFSIIAIESTGIIPSIPVAFAFTASLIAIFGAVYWFLFTSLTGRTLGRTLAVMAAEDLAWMAKHEADSPRFR
jgi:PilZ domain